MCGVAAAAGISAGTSLLSGIAGHQAQAQQAEMAEKQARRTQRLQSQRIKEDASRRSRERAARAPGMRLNYGYTTAWPRLAEERFR